MTLMVHLFNKMQILFTQFMSLSLEVDHMLVLYLGFLAFVLY